jgi:DNA-binding NarL/FixJ family response regulator
MAASIRVLIADDSNSVRGAIRSLLRDESDVRICGEATNHEELLRMLSEAWPDVVLMDVYMPHGKPVDPAYIKAELRGFCVLTMSIWDNDETVRLSQGFGAFKLLNKSNLAFTLMPAIAECMRQRGRSQPCALRASSPGSFTLSLGTGTYRLPFALRNG